MRPLERLLEALGYRVGFAGFRFLIIRTMQTKTKGWKRCDGKFMGVDGCVTLSLCWWLWMLIAGVMAGVVDAVVVVVALVVIES